MAITNPKTLNVRIKNKYDSYENWAASGLVLEAGEIAIAHSSVDVEVDNGVAKQPVLLMKVGNGTDTFKDLPWLSAKAADVLEAAKDTDKLTAFINGVIADAGIASDDAMKELAGDVEAAVGRITTLEGEMDAVEKKAADNTTAIGTLNTLVGDTAVATQIQKAIAELKLADTYDAKGAAAQALTDAKSHAAGLNAAMDTRVQALEAIDHDHANKAELDKIATGDKAKWDAMEQNAKDYADAEDAKIESRVDALEALFEDGEGSVSDQIADAVATETAAREAADTALGNRVKAIEDDYLKAADKTALQDQITANDGDIADLKELVGEEGVASQISKAVAAEAGIARAAEKANADAIDAIEADYLKAADKQALQTQIDTIMSNPDAEGAINSINEFTQYVKDHGTIAEGFRTDIDANADAIEAIAKDYLKAADKTELEGKITTAQNAANKAQGEVDALEEVVATKAAASDLTALAGRVTTAEGEIDTLQDEMDAVEGRATVLEGLVGDTAVDAQIDAAIEALKIGDYAKAADLTAAINQHNTDKAALEAEIAKKADDSALAAIAKSGNVNDLIQTAGDVLVFDCGGAE